jgi:hypothetical protein
MRKVITTFLLNATFLFFSSSLLAQQDTSKSLKPTINTSVFIDVFYAYDFSTPKIDYRQPFLYNHNRHNEFNLNLGILKLNLEHTKYRANFALHAGTYVDDNYRAESPTLKNISEANIGLSLNTKNNLWVDAGIMGSYIGFETALSIDNYTLTRSLLADNSPYYLSGIKLTYTPKNFELVAIVCNGWQRIQRIPGNSLPSFGTQIKYTKNKKTFNWSTFIGAVTPDSIRLMRYFNNLFGQFELSKKINLIAGFDFGFQQTTPNSLDYYNWYSPVIILKYTYNKHWATAVRGEYYVDKNQVIVFTATPNGFQTGGSSLNIDYTPSENIMCRIEGRWLNSVDKLFYQNNKEANNNYFIVGSIAIKFNK